jgi:hypothetical protein
METSCKSSVQSSDVVDTDSILEGGKSCIFMPKLTVRTPPPPRYSYSMSYRTVRLALPGSLGPFVASLVLKVILICWRMEVAHFCPLPSESENKH